MCEVLNDAEVPPSPKVQSTVPGAGVEVLEKTAGELIQTAAGPVKEVVMPPITIGTVVRAVSLQPLLLVATSVAV